MPESKKTGDAYILGMYGIQTETPPARIVETYGSRYESWEVIEKFMHFTLYLGFTDKIYKLKILYCRSWAL